MSEVDPAMAQNDSLDELLREKTDLLRRLEDLSVVLDHHSIIAVTDRRGYILQANEKFVEVSKYPLEELIGAPQSIVNSGYHPRSFWKEMWATIGRGKVWQAEICNRAKDGSEYWVATTIAPLLGDDGRPERYISLRTDVTEIHRADERVREAAYVDTLTGLMNRTATVEMLDHTSNLGCEDYRVFITVELEDLPILIDVFGYAEAESLLTHASDLLRGLSEEPDAVSRVHTSVFGLFFSGLSADKAEAEARAFELSERLVEVLSATIKLDLGFSLQPTLKVGFTLYGDHDELAGVEIFNQAEIARRLVHDESLLLMRKVFKPRMFRPSMIQETHERVSLVQELRRAISEDRLRLFLQPIVQADRSVVAYEALLRMCGADGQLVMPASFIPLAEQTGLIIDLGAWVIDEACRILSEWAKNPETEHLVISVNVSERQLREHDFVDTVLAAIERHGCAADRLDIEVVESLMISNMEHTVATLRRLRAENVRVAIDDFGTGYSSLNHLSRLPLHYLKIDRSFVQSVADDRVDAEVVRMIVSLAHMLDLEVIAEGVEEEVQFAMLEGLGVDYFQGFFFGRPAPIELPGG